MITEWIVDILHSVYEWAQYPFCNPTRSEIGFWCIRVFAVYLQAGYHQTKSQKVWFLLLTFQASVWASISFTYLKMFIYWGTIRGWHSSRFWGCCCLVIRSCLFCNPMDYSPLGSFVHRISQARIVEWVAVSFSRGSSQPRDRTYVSCIGRWILYHWVTREVPCWPK